MRRESQRGGPHGTTYALAAVLHALRSDDQMEAYKSCVLEYCIIMTVSDRLLRDFVVS